MVKLAKDVFSFFSVYVLATIHLTDRVNERSVRMYGFGIRFNFLRNGKDRNK